MALDQSYALSAVEERTAPAHFLPRARHSRLERMLQGRAWTALRVGFDAFLLAIAVGVTVVRAPAADADAIWLAALLVPLTIDDHPWRALVIRSGRRGAGSVRLTARERRGCHARACGAVR